MLFKKILQGLTIGICMFGIGDAFSETTSLVTAKATNTVTEIEDNDVDDHFGDWTKIAKVTALAEFFLGTKIFFAPTTLNNIVQMRAYSLKTSNLLKFIDSNKIAYAALLPPAGIGKVANCGIPLVRFESDEDNGSDPWQQIINKAIEKKTGNLNDCPETFEVDWKKWYLAAPATIPIPIDEKERNPQLDAQLFWTRTEAWGRTPFLSKQ